MTISEKAQKTTERLEKFMFLNSTVVNPMHVWGIAWDCFLRLWPYSGFGAAGSKRGWCLLVETWRI